VDDGNSTLKLTLYLLMWRIWSVPNNVSKWQMGFYSAFKGLTPCTKSSISFSTIYLKTPDEGGKAHAQYLNMQCSLFVLHSFKDILHLLKL